MNTLPVLKQSGLIIALTLMCAAGLLDGADAFPNLLDWRKIVALAENDELSQSGKRTWSVTQGSFQIKSDMVDDPELTCFYATPEPQGNKPSPRGQDAVYFFHTPDPGNRNILDNGFCQRLVSESGMTVFGLSFVHNSKFSDFKDSRQYRRFYAFAQSGAFAAIITAWNQIRQRCDIAKPRFFVFGYSAGAIAAQRFAEEYPSVCDGVVTANGHTFVRKNQASCPFLIIHTYGDGGASEGDGLAAFYRALGNPVTRTYLNPSWNLRADGNFFAYHSLNAAATPLALRYLEGLADLRGKSADGTIPPLSAWPYAVAAEDPQVITSVRGKEWQTPFLEARFTPTPIPSARFYRELLRVPSPSKRLEIPKVGSALVAKPPSVEKAQGVVAVWQKAADELLSPESEAEASTMLDPDLQYACEHRFLAFAVAKTAMLAKALPVVLMNHGKGATLPAAAILFEPEPGDIERTSAVAGLRSLVIVLRSNAEVEPYIPAFQRCASSGVRLRILVSCTNNNEFRSFLIPVAANLRDQFFAPFIAKGQDADASLHQQQLEAAIAFVEKGAVRSEK